MLLFSPSIAKLALGSGIYNLAGWTYGGLISTVNAVSVFSGTQPTAAALLNTSNNFQIYSSPAGTNLLAQFTSIATSEIGSVLQASNFPTATPINTGVASWAVIWDTGSANIPIGDPLPAIYNHQFMVLPVSLTGGNGIVRFNSLNFVSGTPVTMSGFNITSS